VWKADVCVRTPPLEPQIALRPEENSMRHVMKYVYKAPIWAFEILAALMVMRILYDIARTELFK
jgi:hypothetical protein